MEEVIGGVSRRLGMNHNRTVHEGEGNNALGEERGRLASQNENASRKSSDLRDAWKFNQAS